MMRQNWGFPRPNPPKNPCSGSVLFTFIQSRLNSHCQCIAYITLLNSDNVMQIMPEYDLIVDATDNVATRYLLNDASVLLKKPLVSGSALQFEGQVR